MLVQAIVNDGLEMTEEPLDPLMSERTEADEFQALIRGMRDIAHEAFLVQTFQGFREGRQTDGEDGDHSVHTARVGH